MGITQQQRLRRARGLGSSDIAAIVGKDPFRNATDIYWSKVLPPEGDEKETEAQQLGNLLENTLIDWAAAKLGVRTKKNVERVSRLDKRWRANLDAQIMGVEEHIEAKVDGLHVNEWGPEMTDEVPERMLIQATWQLIVTDNQVCWIAALVQGFRARFGLWRVGRNPKLEEVLIRKAEQFMDMVTAETPPDGVACPPLEALKRQDYAVAPEIMLDAESAADLEDYEEAKEQESGWRAEKEACMRHVLNALDGHEHAITPSGARVSYTAQRGAPSFDFEGFRAAHPDLWDKYSSETKARHLRVKHPEQPKE